jgi:Asp-tRNA(Asn)/Glu-tRNA(Gln) amidotransferase A subunit family amidase
MPTEYGSPLYKDNRPGMDSSAVGILRNAGALILGTSYGISYTSSARP